MNDLVLGIDLGGSLIKATLFRGRPFAVVRRVTEPTRDGEWAGDHPVWATSIRNLVTTLEVEFGPIPHLGLCAPGLAAADARSIAHMPDRMRGLTGLDWTRHLARAETVRVLNDAHASLLGEISGGAACGVRNVYLLTLGTGVGGAAVVDGQLLRGHLGRAGHLGHLCLNLDGDPGITRCPGSLEDMIGDHNVMSRSDGRYSSTRELVAAYAAEDQEASRVWLRSIRALACAIASLNNILDPELVLIGGGIAAAGKHLFDPLQRELGQVEWRPFATGVPVRPAELGDWAGAWGAAQFAVSPHSPSSRQPL